MKRADLVSALPEGDVLLVVPPFANTYMACLGVHVLQACAREAGFAVGVFYANMHFAERSGEGLYLKIPDLLPPHLGERIFAAAAYGSAAAPGRDEEGYAEMLRGMSNTSTMPNADEIAAFQRVSSQCTEMKFSEMQRIERETASWADEMCEAVARRDYRIVGCTTMFDETAASVAVLNRIKRIRPDVVTIIGGANCEGEMADGIASLGARIDTIFSGESEATFVDFVRRALTEDRPAEPIIRGEMCEDMEALPCPDFTEFFEQRERLLPSSKIRRTKLRIPYETSRGCWWAEKHACKFCGYSAKRARYRLKSPDKVVRDLKVIMEGQPSRTVQMADNVIPRESLPDLATKLSKEISSIGITWSVRPNLSLREALALKRAGVTALLAGIESLSTSLLKRMNKGVSVRDNVALLRYGRVACLDMYWNMMWGFPGDQASDYEEMIDIMPLLRHLPPPSSFVPMGLARSSVYLDHPQEYGITNMRPRIASGCFLPPQADIGKIGSYFDGDFDCASFSDLDVVRRLYDSLRAWQACWQGAGTQLLGGAPKLHIARASDGRYHLEDTRGLPGAEKASTLSRQQAAYSLVARRVEESSEAQWVLARGLAVARDNWIVPLATAEPELLLEFESESSA